MDNSDQETEKLKALFQKYKYYPIDDSFDISSLAHLNLYRKVTLKGKTSYILFHKKGSPIPEKIPRSLYIGEEDIDAFLTVASNRARSAEPRSPESTSSVEQYEEQVLNNGALSPEQKINLTMQSAGEVMHNIFECSSLDEKQVKEVEKTGEKMFLFLNRVVQDSNTESQLMSLLIGHDYYTYSHCIHVSIYSVMLAGQLRNEGLKLNEDEVRSLCVGGLMHDIGKVKIDRKIINKNGRLTAEEFSEIKKHPFLGADIARQAHEQQEVVSVIEQHHECWFGGGYPFNLKGEKILPLSRIACICDVFDALTTRRSYRQALPPFEALSLMMSKMHNTFYYPFLQNFIKFLGQQVR